MENLPPWKNIVFTWDYSKHNKGNKKHWMQPFPLGETGIPERDLDLALAASCDHSVYDYGTFGFWGAFLAGGVTVLAEDINGRGEPVSIQKAADTSS